MSEPSVPALIASTMRCKAFSAVSAVGATPALPDKVTGWQAKAGHTVHILFYVLMIVMPLTGWLMIGANGKAAPVDFFGLFTIDMAVGKNAMLADIGHEGHEILATPLVVLIGLHVLGALKHQFIDKMPFVQRMWP